MSLSLDHALTLQRCRKGKVVDLGAGADDAIHARGSEAAHRAVATLTQVRSRPATRLRNGRAEGWPSRRCRPTVGAAACGNRYSSN